MLSPLACSYASLCTGCDLLLKPYQAQVELKKQELRSALSWTLSKAGVPTDTLPETRWVEIDRGGLRDRVDLVIDRRSGRSKLGLFDKFKTGLVDLQGCPQLSPALESWFVDFRKIPVPVLRGSIRLRVAPDGTRGVWLDLANLDVKELLEKRETLDALRELAVVEIGQRRKRLVEVEGQLKLADPVLFSWFETYVENRALPLSCAIGSFTQTGFRANRALVGEMDRQVGAGPLDSAIEFGSGIGNLTFPLAARAKKVRAFEIDSLATEGLRKTRELSGLRDRIEIIEGNFQAAREVDFTGVDLVLVDPPRSGLQKFLEPLVNLAHRPARFVYVSCFTESFAVDSARLLSLGYRITDLAVVDQFPQSRHFEIVASFERR